MATRTITLTNRPPVKIDEDTWGLIAVATAKDYDNQYEFQANRTSKWHIGVRQHDDGRAIVYASYNHTSAFQSESDYSCRAGVLLDSSDDLPAAINEVAREIASQEHASSDAEKWPTLARNCIADLPAEELV